jgi:hypothetical protein
VFIPAAHLHHTPEASDDGSTSFRSQVVLEAHMLPSTRLAGVVVGTGEVVVVATAVTACILCLVTREGKTLTGKAVAFAKVRCAGTRVLASEYEPGTGQRHLGSM